MNILLALLLIIAFAGIRVAGAGTWQEDAMDIQRTRTVCGVFVMMVFLSQASSYMTMGSGDRIYHVFRTAFSYLIAAPFFFYSGYGVFQSAKNSGHSYVKTMPYKRIFRVWYHFAIAMGIYCLLVKIYGYHVNPVKLPGVFLGWYSIGGNNWFIFDILLLYLLSYLSLQVFRKDLRKAAWFNLVLCFAAGVILCFVRQDNLCFSNLILVYPVGMLYGCYRERIDRWIQHSDGRYWTMLVLSIAVFIGLTFFRRYLVVFEILGILFVWIMILLTLKIQVGNPVLRFLGDHMFEIFIYQRIPMIVLSQYGIVQHHALFGLAGFAFTAILAVVMKLTEDGLDCLLRIQTDANTGENLT